MRRCQSMVTIFAPGDHIWNILTDVRRWNEWTPSVKTIEPLDNSFALGSRFRIEQPKLKPSVWKIIHIQAPIDFSWETKSPGIKVLAEHRIEQSASGCVVTLRVCFAGLMGSIAGMLSRVLTEQYLQLECAGLKRRAEGMG